MAVRFTYEGADATGAACLSAPEGYGLPLGSTGRWAFGQEVPDPDVVRAFAEPRIELYTQPNAGAHAALNPFPARLIK